MRFDIVTIFEDAFTSYFGSSLLKRAQARKLITIRFHNPRNFTRDAHRTVDEKPYGGGVGMVIQFMPIYKCVQHVTSKIKNQRSKTRIILFSAKGKVLTQKKVQQLAKYDRLIFICGHYEGIDERVAKHVADEELSIGQYVLTGGEIPAMVCVDAVSRYVPGVLGKAESTSDESFSQEGKTEYPQYTRPEVVSIKSKTGKAKLLRVPKVLVSGDHKKIENWRNIHRGNQK